jgi:hypothetical protein
MKNVFLVHLDIEICEPMFLFLKVLMLASNLPFIKKIVINLHAFVRNEARQVWCSLGGAELDVSGCCTSRRPGEKINSRRLIKWRFLPPH